MTHNALFVFKVSNEREIDWNQLLNSIDCKATENIFFNLLKDNPALPWKKLNQSFENFSEFRVNFSLQAKFLHHPGKN